MAGNFAIYMQWTLSEAKFEFQLYSRYFMDK